MQNDDDLAQDYLADDEDEFLKDFELPDEDEEGEGSEELGLEEEIEQE